jgi:hypothetical protein
LLPDYGSGDGGGFNGICMRWMAKWMKDRGQQSGYLSWMQQNANAAWNRRRTSDNLSWNRWNQQTPTGTLASFDCSSSVVALQVVPADNGVRFFSDANYAGTAGAFLGRGNYTMAQLQAAGVANDSASSIRIPAGYTVIVYQHDNFTGTSWTFTSDTGWIGSAANDQMTSCRIQ